MKLLQILPFAALATAFVIPDEKVMSQVAIESHRPTESLLNKFPSKSELVSEAQIIFNKAAHCSKNAFDEAVELANVQWDRVTEKVEDAALHTQAWLDTAYDIFDVPSDPEDPHHPPHHGPHDDDPPHHKHPHHGHHGHDSHKPNMTVYQLIASSKYTTKLAKLISEYDDLVDLLNGTAANYTVFAPTDKAFEKIPSHAPKPTEEQIKEILTYHVSGEFYPASRVLVTHTVPTLLKGEHIGGELQRLSTNIGLRGLTVNFYSRIVAVNIFGTNGVIHGVDSVLLPPPKSAKIVQLLPSEFSTLELGLAKTGLFPYINDTSNHVGGTLFAPSNFAFQKLGPRINAFLFSDHGLKYLKALLEYHVVANQTLYSDAYYKAESTSEEIHTQNGIPKGLFHIDLPTILKDKSLSVDVARYGRIITIKINGFSTVTIEDGIAADGVVHVVSNVLVPPKSLGGVMKVWEGETMTEQDLMERLDPFIAVEEL